MNDSNARSSGLSEEHAHRLLARAFALDSQHRDAVSLTELRAAAIEAGIDGVAFDRAVAELGPDAGVTPSTPSVVTSRWTSLISNLKAAFAFWVALTILTRLGYLLPADWTVSAVGDLLATGVGVWFAFRFRAKVIQLALIGIGVAELSLLLIHLIFGIQAAQGGPTQVAVLTAGLLGAAAVALSGALGRRRNGSALVSGAPAVAPASGERPASTSLNAELRAARPLRLVRIAAV